MKINKTKLAVVSASVVGSASAMAADPLPSAAVAAMGQVSALADSLIALAWPITVTITLAIIGISLFKKFSKKSVS
ncbi:major coat protein [Aliivibrio sifiae]|uniref:major coat protein n=1 Tax=Aliivibrio sifiae TaxID=566293 RepID=UPI003D12852D